jgi:SAM-dependent methyltransferase
MLRRTIWPALALLAACCLLPAQEKSVKPGINDAFKDPDVKKFTGTFEGESREIFVQRKAIVTACKLKPGQVVADIGAGTGLFTRLFARQVGEKGKVYAVDIAPKFLAHIEKTCKEAKLTNVKTVRCTQTSCELPASSIDVAFVCDTYHHFEFPFRTLATIHKALKPRGRLIIVDFHRIPGKSREWILGHVRAGQDVVLKEIVSSGFKLAGEEKKLGLKENYFLTFEKVDKPAPKPKPGAKDSARVDFTRDVRPILADVCFTCHGPDARKRKAGLRLDTAQGGRGAVVPGKPGESELFKRITSADAREHMPPPKTGRKLSAAQVAVLKQWIEEGARWQTHWAYAAPRRQLLPAVGNPTWPRNAIDHFVLARLEKEGLAPSPEATRTTLVRRLSLDLTGLPPALEEVEAFVNDRRPDAYRRLVDRLLASPRFGERLAHDWLDSARYADSNGYQSDATRTMWPWRDWTVRALGAGMPFDQFTVEQIAGDLLPGAGVEQKIATGFHRNHMLNGEGGRVAEESRIDYVVDRVDTTATVWLGLTMGCARCHDHKYDPFTQKDYYRLFAYFNNLAESGAVDRGGNAAPVLGLPTPAQVQKRKELQQQIRDLEAASKTAAPAGKAEQQKQLKGKRDALAALERSILNVMVMEDRPQPRQTHILVRGAWDRPGEKVTAGVIDRLAPAPGGAPANRLGLARWLVSPDNPLTARVIVNRYWQLIFGTGLVKTSEDFGVQGEPPSHPELLDWLAVEFRESGWDLKHLLRLIVTSATYRQSSALTSRLGERDPDNRLLSRGPRYRLSSHTIRDQALALSGLLVERLGGPSVRPYQPAGIWEELSFGRIRYVQDRGPNLYRRSLYTFWRRTVGRPTCSTPPPGRCAWSDRRGPTRRSTPWSR